MSELILGIETSCDDTAAAVVSSDLEVLSNVISRQLEIHARYGGVVPEIASRVHVCEIVPTISRALAEAGVSGHELAAIAVTRGPGLVGSLLVGISAAKALALAWGKPVVAINHLEGHMASASLGSEVVEYPCLVLLVSGGHSLLARVPAPGSYEVLGSTRDDSAGEAYDKVARLLGLGYPGGPVLDRLSSDGEDVLRFPRPLIHEGFDFSFSGLKSAVAHHVRRNPAYRVADVAASFVNAVMDVLLAKLGRALEHGSYRSLAVVGGVAASPVLRRRLAEVSARYDVAVCLPPLTMAMDNAAMIAAAAWPRLAATGGDDLDFSVSPSAGLPIDG